MSLYINYWGVKLDVSHIESIKAGQEVVVTTDSNGKYGNGIFMFHSYVLDKHELSRRIQFYMDNSVPVHPLNLINRAV